MYLSLFFIPSYCCLSLIFLFHAGIGYDERANWSLRILWDSVGPFERKTGCKGEGGVIVAGLQKCLDKEARLDQAALKGVGGTSWSSKKILKDKKAEISNTKSKLRHIKDAAIKEYCDSNNLLRELGGSFADDFNDCIRQVKASFLDLSHINIDAQPQTLAQLVSSVGTDDLFVDDPMTKPLGDGDTPLDQAKSIGDEVHALEGDSTVKRKDGEDPVT